MSPKEYSLDNLDHFVLLHVEDSELLSPSTIYHKNIDIELSEYEILKAQNEDELLQMTFEEFDNFLRSSTLLLSTDTYKEHKGTEDNPIAMTFMIESLLTEHDLKDAIICVNYDLFNVERNLRKKMVEVAKTFAIVEAWELLALNSDCHGARKHAQETAMIHSFSHAQQLGLLDEYNKFIQSVARRFKDKNERENFQCKINHAYGLFAKNSQPQKSDYSATILNDLRECRK